MDQGISSDQVVRWLTAPQQAQVLDEVAAEGENFPHRAALGEGIVVSWVAFITRSELRDALALVMERAA